MSGILLGGGRPLVFIGGPCVVESEDRTLRIGETLATICGRAGVPFIFKASFDKANRTSGEAFRGPGLHRGLEVLARVKQALGVPVTTDVHEPTQAAAVAEVADLLQVPALLSRQTDLLTACGRTDRPVNVKKGQFMAPWDMEHALAKVAGARPLGGAPGVMVTERGTTFGYNNLVVDMRSLAVLAGLGAPVCFDATHSVQLPGGLGGSSGGQREHAPLLARAAVAAGVDAVFAEVHDDPDAALSDGPNMLVLDAVEPLLRTLLAIDQAARGVSR